LAERQRAAMLGSGDRGARDREARSRLVARVKEALAALEAARAEAADRSDRPAVRVDVLSCGRQCDGEIGWISLGGHAPE
jgi:hypothetical protein